MYTNSFGSLAANSSNCDDCYDGVYSFGAGNDIDFFGTTYSGLYVGSNGYVTFGSGSSNFSPSALNVQTVNPMIAGLFTDLDSRDNAASNVYVNNSTLGQLVITWENMGHWPSNYGVLSTFQLVIRSDEYSIGAGEGQIGFFYDNITDTNDASAGFGDGLAAINTGEEAFYNGPATGLSKSAPRWYDINNGAPIATPPTTVPEPTSLALLGLGFMGMRLLRKKSM